MDELHQPAEALKAEEEENRKKQRSQPTRSFPERPEKDVLLFLIEHAPLKHWQRDVLSIIRDEAYYFSPQGQTKIMNEGWASLLAQHHHDAEGARAVRGDRLRRPPLRHDGDERRGGSTRTSSASNCSATSSAAGTPGSSARNGRTATTWRRSGRGTSRLGLGRQKIFEVRKVHNDITFIDTFLTPEFCQRAQAVLASTTRSQTQNYVIETREFQKVKQRLLFSLTNFGKPWIYVVDGNYRNRGELLLRHEYNGVELKLNEAQDTLANVQSIWGRPVHLETVLDDKPTLLSFDGTDHTHQAIGADNDARRKPARKP